MLSHGVVSGALFLCVGVIYDRMHTREIAPMAASRSHAEICAAVHAVHDGVGRPARHKLRGFVGEFLTTGWRAYMLRRT
jgi:NADH:ubiquinone oxidoreductase subunit 4 (subunit M)